MKWMMIVLLGGLNGAVAVAQQGESGVFERIQADCSSVKECVCQEVCNDVCRIVNGKEVCDQSCKTICEYGTSGAKAERASIRTEKTWGSGSEDCVTHCGDAADEACGDDSKCRSAFFRGCMRTCWL